MTANPTHWQRLHSHRFAETLTLCRIQLSLCTTALLQSLRHQLRTARHVWLSWHWSNWPQIISSSHLPSPLRTNWTLSRNSFMRVLADKYIHLYNTAQAMRAMLKPECSYALLFVPMLDRHFNMLGQQVITSLCRTGVATPHGQRLYLPQDLTLALMGTHASLIWELNRTLAPTLPSTPSHSYYGDVSYI